VGGSGWCEGYRCASAIRNLSIEELAPRLDYEPAPVGG